LLTCDAVADQRQNTLLRAKPSKDGDAELGDFGDQRSPCQPGRQRLDKSSSFLAAFFVFGRIV
jgi:hypothetical protein